MNNRTYPRALLAFTCCFVGTLVAVSSFATSMSDGPYLRPGRTERVSVATDSTQGTGASSFAAISADGRYVAFQSYATDLVPGDTNVRFDIFVADRVTGRTERISVASDGTQADSHSFYPAISADGRFISFQGPASNLVPGDTNTLFDIFVRDRLAGTTERVSVATDGTPGNDHSSFSGLSADGRYVAFHSPATNLVGADANGAAYDVFVRDRMAGTTELVSVASDGTQGNDFSGYPVISADGRFVAFMSLASNLSENDLSRGWDVFVHDRTTHTTERISVAVDGTETDSGSFNPTISADGRFVAFDSGASNLVPQDTDGVWDVFVRDRTAGTTERASVTSDGSEADGTSGGGRPASLSADGRYVAFHSQATNLVPGDANSAEDIFVRDRATGTTERVSVTSDGTEGTAMSFTASISADGRGVAFHSSATNLVPGDTNVRDDVFVRDRGPAVGIGMLTATFGDGSASASGWASFSGDAIALADDPANDGASGAAAAGGELTGASLAYRPERGDLLVRLRVTALPRAAGGTPGVLYGLKLTVGSNGISYEVRAAQGEAAGSPLFALYNCTSPSPACTQVAVLIGGMGTIGHEITAAVPLAALGAIEGDSLTGLLAYSAYGNTVTGPGTNLDDAALPSIDIPIHAVALGIAPAGTPEDGVTFNTSAALAEGTFSGILDVGALSPGDYEVWAQACLGDQCGTAKVPIQVTPPRPAAFGFIERTGVATSVFVTSEAKTLSGFAGLLPVSVASNGQYRIDGGAWTSAAGQIAASSTLSVRHISSKAAGTATETPVTVGAYRTTFRSVTSSLDRTPDAFGFGNRTGVDPGTVVESGVVTPTGFNTGISIVPGPSISYRVNGGTWTTATGTLQPTQTLQVRHTSSTSSLGYTKTYLKVGGVVGYFTTRTK